MSQERESDFICDLIFSEPLDCRGPIQLDGNVSDDQVEKFVARRSDEFSFAKNEGAAVDPLWDEVIGTLAAEERGETHLEKRSSSPGRIRLEKTMLDGEPWVFGYDHCGEVVYTRADEQMA